jgi:flagellar basal body-associated protein FliL
MSIFCYYLRSENRTDRTIKICLCLLVVVAIVAAAVIYVRNGNTKYVSPTAPITTLVSNVPVVELTTTSTRKLKNIVKLYLIK